MQRPYVHRVRITNFRCIQSAELHLTPLHALVGPNDSGKSSLLAAILGGQAVCWITQFPAAFGPDNRPHPGRFPDISSDHILDENTEGAQAAVRAARVRRQLRLDPDALRQHVPLIPTGTVLWFNNEVGHGLPGLYDALLSRDRNAFMALDKRFCALFPTVRGLRLWNTSGTTKSLGITLHNGQEVSAPEMSEGMLYWLAYAIVEHLAQPGILMIEEPENGLHPARIAEVVHVLREISERTQIIIATHSPLVLNELKPNEVTIVTRPTPPGFTICTPMTATKNFEERSKTYALGELWLSYADGNIESNLVSQT